jgi:hypothetical protein
MARPTATSDAVGSLRARLALRINRLERRWMPNEREQARDEAMVTRRLAELAAELASAEKPEPPRP